jgi:hypothetical protein
VAPASTEPAPSPYLYADNQPTVLADPSGDIAWGADLGQALSSISSGVDISEKAVDVAARVAGKVSQHSELVGQLSRYGEALGKVSDILTAVNLGYDVANMPYQCIANGLSSAQCGKSEVRTGEDLLGLIPGAGLWETLDPSGADRFTKGIENGISNFFYNVGSAYYSLTGQDSYYYGYGTISK